MLFRKTENSKPQLSQAEREAIVDLLHLCLYADSHIALREGQFMSDVTDVIGWDSGSSFSSYEARSVSSARAGKENAVTKKEFLEFAAERLKSKESRALALDLCKQLFSVDGTETREEALLGEIRSALK